MFVMVSRDNLLNRYSDVDDEGKFVSEIGSGRARFLTVADQLLSGKKDSACMALFIDKMHLFLISMLCDDEGNYSYLKLSI